MRAVMHLLAAALSGVAVLLYLERSAWLGRQPHTDQRGWPAVTRIGLALWMTSVSVGFLTLAVGHAPFVGRHWFILAAVVLVIVGHLGMLRGGRSEPT